MWARSLLLASAVGYELGSDDDICCDADCCRETRGRHARGVCVYCGHANIPSSPPQCIGLLSLYVLHDFIPCPCVELGVSPAESFAQLLLETCENLLCCVCARGGRSSPATAAVDEANSCSAADM